MAGWISSKLKVAETLLQQIDQQAAESLGKGERNQSDGLDFNTSPKPSGIVPLRDQLKKETPERNETFAKLSSDDANRNGRKLSSGDNSNNRKWGKEATKPDSNPRSTLKDSDWTELLSTPKQPTLTKTSRANGVSGARGVRKTGEKVRNVGLNVKGNDKVTGTVRKGGYPSIVKANGGVGDGRSDAEESRISSSIPRVSGVGFDDKASSRWESRHNKGKEGSPERKKEGEDEKDIMGSENESLDSENLEIKADSTSLAKNTHMPEGMIDRVSNKGKEAVHDDEKIRGNTLAANNPNSDIANYGTRDLKSPSYSGSDNVSDSDSESNSTSDSEIEREREERIQRRRQILAAKAAAKAEEAIKEQENFVARLEGEKQSLEKILEERAKQAAQEASELQSTMMETMEAAELEKQKHNHTRMEVLTRLAKLETANAELAKSLATAQWNLEIEVNRVAELRNQVEVKEAVHEELKRRISSTHQTRTSLTNLMPSKGIVLEKEMLEAEISFVADKIARLQEKATELEANIDLTLKEMESSTDIEVELKRRLRQMTDHLIQKQAQVEALSSDKATLLFRIEAVSRLLDENKSLFNAGDISDSSRDDLEAGSLESSSYKLRPMFQDKIQSGRHHLGSLVRQLDAIFSAGSVFLARNPAAKLWSLVYLVCLHLWVLYILFSHPRSAEDATSSSVLSLENINNTHGV